MNIQIQDGMGYVYRIDSQDLDLIGRWFAEKAPILISADERYNHPVYLNIYPTNKEEGDLIGVYQMAKPFTIETILELIGHLQGIVQKIQENENTVL